MERIDPFGWVGSTIDERFAVESVAGEGAFGVVYRGRHLGLDAAVAIKCLKIPANLRPDRRAEFLATFRQEARLLHRLSRRTTGIVQALDVGAATAPAGDWTPYAVMEWLDGKTLEEELLDRQDAGVGPLGLEEAIDLLAPAAEALAIAHDENVAHRDVKPPNIFLASISGGRVVKVLDFGIAKLMAEAPSLTAALAETGAELRAFTPQYAAPEQFDPRHGVTGPWTDVYAMALVLVEIVSGRPALGGGNLMQLFVATADEKRRPSLHARGVAAPAAIEAVVRRALEVRPEARFQNMRAMWDALGEARRAARGLAATTAAPVLAPTPGVVAAGGPASAARVSLGSLGSGPTGENRICTVMFVDFSGVATALSEQLDLEEIQDVVARCFVVAIEQVGRLGGLLDRPVGDCAMAVFGLPRARDDDAQRAVQAAVRVRSAIARVALPAAARAARPGIRIGVSTGRVFAAMLPEGAASPFAVVGQTVTAAARLQQSAPPGAIVIGRDTRRQVANAFEVAPCATAGPLGSGEACLAFEVLGPLAYQRAFEIPAFHGIDTRLVGRAAEMQRLHDALDTVRSSRRLRVLTLVGPAGVGRTRLLAEFLARLPAALGDFVTLSAQCSSPGVDTSYGLAAALVRARFQIHESDAREVVVRKLRRGLRWLRMRSVTTWAGGGRSTRPPPSQASFDWDSGGGRAVRAEPDDEPDRTEIEDAIRQMAQLLGARSEDEGPVESVAPDEARAQAKHRIAAALGRIVAFAARRMPVVVLCDDIHWADDASLDLLDDLTVRIERLPVLVIGAARPALLERRSHWGEGREAHERVDLGPLARRYVEEMNGERLARVRELRPETVGRLADRAEGNPLILEETLHLLVDAGAIETPVQGAWSIHEQRLGDLALPATIQGIVQARLDRLDPELRDVLARAAVVGRTFWQGVVGRLLGADGAPALGAATDQLLGRLRERQIVRVREAAAFPGEREYVFAESATQEVAYASLSRKVRQPLHAIVAEWLAEHMPGPAGAAPLGWHYDRAGAVSRAAAEYARAGAHAARLGQNAEALRHFERARELRDEQAERQGAEPAEAAAPSADVTDEALLRERVRLRLDLGDVLRRVGRLDEAVRIYEEARALLVAAAGQGRPRLEPREILQWEARIDFRLALVHKIRGSLEAGQELVERAIACATQGGAPEETPAMYTLLAFLCRRRRNAERAWQAAIEGLRAYRAVRQPGYRSSADTALLLLGLGAALHARGRLVAAERSVRQALRIVDESDRPDLAAEALYGLAGIRAARGDLSAVHKAQLRALRLMQRAGDLHRLAIAFSNLSDVELRLGQVRAAIEHARSGLQLGKQVGAGSDLAALYSNLAEASLAAGEIEAALDAGAEALAIAERGSAFYLGEVAAALVRICGQAAASSPSPSPVRRRAAGVAKTLLASLSKHGDQAGLRERLEECRAILAALTGDG
ncbi:MAG: AAA family ATPase [Deltaproteobacteria bacterium]|nr:AAA family ATPase [Deltaproteobacteria bacterium]